MPRNEKIANTRPARLTADEVLIFDGLIESLARCDEDTRLDALLIAYLENTLKILNVRRNRRNGVIRSEILRGYDGAERVFAGRAKIRQSA